MTNINEITREKWVLDCFPEWGEWLIEDIDETIVKANTFAMWWLGCTGIWVKSEGGANLCIDMYSGNSKVSHYKWPKNHKGYNFQLCRMCGSDQIHQNPRSIPHVIDPFKIRKLDAFLATHDHADHMDFYSSAAVLKKQDVPFIGPKFSANKWREWGIPESRIITVKPGEVLNIKDFEINVVESFDRTALISIPPEGSIEGRLTNDMDVRAVNYIIKTSGGIIYHSGDSHFSNYSLKHGKRYNIDVAIVAYGENPPGITDKLTSSDVLRMAENLHCKVIIPVHYNIWPPFNADPAEIDLLYEFKKYRMQYKFKPFIWKIGGKFIYPDDKDKRYYSYPRGFTDAFDTEPNLPYKIYL